MHVKRGLVVKCSSVTNKYQTRFAHVHSSSHVSRSISHLAKEPSSCCSRDWFISVREEIRKNMERGEKDKSLAGAIDRRVRPIVNWINYHTLPCHQTPTCSSLAVPPASFVTTSSCSGRILLFHREDDATVQRQMKRGGLGLGKLIETHDPIEDVQTTIQTSFLPILENFSEERKRRQKFSASQRRETIEKERRRGEGEQTLPSLHSPSRNTELLHLQFRPMILHVMVSHMEAAKLLLDCAHASGQNASTILSCSRFREERAMEEQEGTPFPPWSGTSSSSSSLSPGGSPPSLHRHMLPHKITCCITSSLLMDVPFRTNSRWMFGGPPSVSSPTTSLSSERDCEMCQVEGTNRKGEKDVVPRPSSYPDPWTPLLEHCLFHANELFKENFSRMDRFLEEVKKRLTAVG